MVYSLCYFDLTKIVLSNAMRKGKIVRVSQSKNIEQAIMDAILIEIDEKIKERKKQNKGGSIRCCTYGVTSEIIKRHRRANPWLNRDVLNNYKRSLTRKKKLSVLTSTLTEPPYHR